MKNVPRAQKVIPTKNSAALEEQLKKVKQEELQKKAVPFMEEIRAVCDKHGLELVAAAQLQIAEKK